MNGCEVRGAWVVGVAACLATAVAQADIVRSRIEWIVPGEVARTVPVSDDDPELMNRVMAYDNWTPINLGGQTRLTGQLRTGADEYGDDLNLVPLSGGLLDSAGFTTFNAGTTGDLERSRISLRWYDPATSTLIGEFRFMLIYSSPIAPGRGEFTGFLPGDLASLGIVVPDSVTMTVQHFDPVGIAPADLGMRFGGPNTIGSSTRFARNFTIGQNIDLGQGNNLGLFIRTVPIPAPAPAALGIILGLGFGLRRRRASMPIVFATGDNNQDGAIGPADLAEYDFRKGRDVIGDTANATIDYGIAQTN
jgi:hypothetical protein